MMKSGRKIDRKLLLVVVTQLMYLGTLWIATGAKPIVWSSITGVLIMATILTAVGTLVHSYMRSNQAQNETTST